MTTADRQIEPLADLRDRHPSRMSDEQLQHVERARVPVLPTRALAVRPSQPHHTPSTLPNLEHGGHPAHFSFSKAHSSLPPKSTSPNAHRSCLATGRSTAWPRVPVPHTARPS